MTKQKILYSIRVADVANLSQELNIQFGKKDLDFIEDKIGDFFGSRWYDAIAYALEELQLKITNSHKLNAKK